MDCVNAEGLRGGDVRLDIIDIDGALRIDPEALDEQPENARIRLDQADLARNQNSPKPAEKLKPRQRRRIGLSRPIGEAK